MRELYPHSSRVNVFLAVTAGAAAADREGAAVRRGLEQARDRPIHGEGLCRLDRRLPRDAHAQPESFRRAVGPGTLPYRARGVPRGRGPLPPRPGRPSPSRERPNESEDGAARGREMELVKWGAPKWPPIPPALVAPRRSRGAPRPAALS